MSCCRPGPGIHKSRPKSGPFEKRALDPPALFQHLETMGSFLLGAEESLVKGAQVQEPASGAAGALSKILGAVQREKGKEESPTRLLCADQGCLLFTGCGQSSKQKSRQEALAVSQEVEDTGTLPQPRIASATPQLHSSVV